jgi:uncharacterized paraquat-inducible protein A
MYCSSCGTAVKPDLNYCKRCGAKLSGTRDDEITKPVDPDSLVWAIVVVFAVGLGTTIGLIAVIRNLNFHLPLTIAFPILSFLLMLAIEGAFIWKLLGPRRSAKEVRDGWQSNEQVTKELGAEQTPWITDSAPSVSEHTTHTLEPIHSEPKLK